MTDHVKHTPPNSDVALQLDLLAEDRSSDSGRLLHGALSIESKHSVGYGVIYCLKPRGVSADAAIEIYKEMNRRFPNLLEEMVDCALRRQPALEFHVRSTSSSMRTSSNATSSHDRIAAIPILIGWLRGAA